MRGSVKKWGNSAAVRIPAAVLEATRVKIGEDVDVREEGGRIVIEPVCRYRLDDLLKRITEDNRHEAIDFGSPEGKEVW